MKNYIFIFFIIFSTCASAQSYEERVLNMKIFLLAAQDGVSFNQKKQDYFIKQESQSEIGMILLKTIAGTTSAILNSKTPVYSGVTTYSSQPRGDYDTENPSTSSTSTGTSRKKNTCGMCQGKGYTIEYSANYTGKLTKKHCNECGKEVDSTHYHKTCTLCHGTGIN